MVDILLGPRPLDLLSPRVPGHLDELLQLFNQFFERETRGYWREEEWGEGREEEWEEEWEKRERGGGERERGRLGDGRGKSRRVAVW